MRTRHRASCCAFSNLCFLCFPHRTLGPLCWVPCLLPDLVLVPVPPSGPCAGPPAPHPSTPFICASHLSSNKDFYLHCLRASFSRASDPYSPHPCPATCACACPSLWRPHFGSPEESATFARIQTDSSNALLITISWQEVANAAIHSVSNVSHSC